jgi:hypothetical protein
MRFASWKRSFCLAVGIVFGAALASASGISYTCDPTINSTVAGTCATLNSTIAGLYSSTFTDANASIYITYGSIGLNLAGQTFQFYTNVTYTAYANALTLDESDANDATTVGSLGGNVTNPVVAGDGVALTSALAATLNLAAVAGSSGVTPTNSPCTLGTAGCYNSIVTLTNVANTFYYRSGGQPAGTYDFYTEVEHETDEVLGTSSCITGSGNNPATITTGVGCTNHFNGNPAVGVSAPDLFRYSGSGTRSYLATANGTAAYFSINGSTTNIANYNNQPNGADYGDWNSDSNRVQNAFGSPDTNGVDITNDGGSEILVLDAVGYTLTSSVPEPGTGVLLAAALAVLAGLARRRAV